MPLMAIVYHNGSGHTDAQVDAVVAGAKPLVEVVTMPADAPDWEMLHSADAIVLGSPTYMGTVSAQLKGFMDATGDFWATQPWKDKIAGGFTHSGHLSGDKLNTLMTMGIFAAQHGMIWVGMDLIPPTTSGDTTYTNRLGGWLGPMGQSGQAPAEGDLATATHYGKRLATVMLRMKGK